jgi:hypothetical protein
MAKTLLVAVAGAVAAYALEVALVGAWGEDPGYALLFVRASLATAVGGLVIVAGSLLLRIGELGTIVTVLLDAVRRRSHA